MQGYKHIANTTGTKCMEDKTRKQYKGTPTFVYICSVFIYMILLHKNEQCWWLLYSYDGGSCVFVQALPFLHFYRLPSLSVCSCKAIVSLFQFVLFLLHISTTEGNFAHSLFSGTKVVTTSV